jgi:uncharacterized membrane protein
MTTPARTERLASIDVLRTAAIMMMTVVHFAENLAGSWNAAEGPLIGASRYWWLPTGIAAPMFTFLAGVSYRLWADAQRTAGRSEQALSKITVRRGLFLILFGLVFNVVVWLPEDVFNWDVLTLVGVAMLALDLARRAPAVLPACSCVLIVAVAPALRAAADYAAFWEQGFYDYDFTIADIVLGCLVTGYFPLFPWLALPLAGFVATPSLYGRAGGGPSRLAWLAGGLLIATAAAMIAVRPFVPTAFHGSGRAWSMFPATTAYVLGMAGAVLLLASVLHRVIDVPGRSGPILRLAGAMSRHSLSLYVLHHVAHVWPLWVAGAVAAGETTALWQVAMPVGTAVAWATAFLVVAAWLARRMDGPGAPSLERLLRWLCEP